MKKIFLAIVTVSFSIAGFTQTETQTTQATVVSNTEVMIPEHLKGLTTETLTSSHIFPALGNYKLSGSAEADVVITLDETNKGIVWVSGLPQGSFKALMKRSPSTYKIPAQKSAEGKPVPEGTLYLNPETKELTIVLGRAFNDADPTTSLTIDSKKKQKGWQYTGVKAETETVVTSPASGQ